MCMHNLESKDFKCRKKGYKRYWVVTNIDRVAADIKNNVDVLKGQPVFTRDFTRMYTSIPQVELVATVRLALEEVFAWHASKIQAEPKDLRVKVSFPRVGHGEACFSKKGFTFDEILQMLQAVCTEVYFQQAETGRVLRQKQGLPMGGKASAELANLYCYVKESRFIDSLIQQGRLEDAKRWFNTWRYIDDLCGFGDRGNMWQEISYGMEHVETTDIRFSPLDQKSQVVFLGMKVVSNSDGISLSVQPKGDGWAWLPQRFIDYSSCHTHYTKWYLFHGLLVRALTICSSEEEFFKAVIHYAQGLIARGFPATSLKRSWNAFCYAKIQNKLARRNLTQKFIEWVNSQDFSACHLDEEAQRKQRKTKTMGKYIGTLACGMHALNHILRAYHKPLVTAEDIHSTASEMADKEEALLYASDSTMVLDLALDPRGNYPVDVLLHMLQSRLGLPMTRWAEGQPLHSAVLLVGSGQHWQAVVKGPHDEWFVLEQSISHAVQDLHRLLLDKLKHGAVYQVGTLNDSPNIRCLDSILQSRTMAGSSPPVKRKKVSVASHNDLDFPVVDILHFDGVVPPPEPLVPRAAEDNKADDCMDVESEPLNLLIEAFTPEPPPQVQMTESSDARPQRERKQTPLYQSDEVAMLDKKVLKEKCA